MTPLHQAMCDKYGDPDVEALQEWQSPHGYLGTYRSHGKYLYIAILTDLLSTFPYHPSSELIPTMTRDAFAIATFAGAQLIEVPT